MNTKDEALSNQKPLSDARIKELECMQILTESEPFDVVMFARAIERAHGIGE